MMDQKRAGISCRTALIWRFVLLLGTVLWIAFIFSHSLSPGDQSDSESTKVQGMLQFILDSIGLSSIGISHHFVRKMAHFIEFFLLGMLLTGIVRSFTSYLIRHLPIGLFLGLLIPVCDEFIQSFVEGRSSQVSDVLLDFGGVVCGTVLCCIGIVLWDRRNKRHFKRQ